MDYLNSKFSYDENNGEVFIRKASNKIVLPWDKSIATVDGVKVNIDSPPFLDKDTIFVPLRIVSEKLCYKVGYSNGEEVQNWHLDDTEILLPPNHAIVKNIVNIIVDEKHRFNDELTMEIAMKKLRKLVLMGWITSAKN